MRYAALLLAIVLLSGCATTDKTDWTQWLVDEADNEQLVLKIEDCQVMYFGEVAVPLLSKGDWRKLQGYFPTTNMTVTFTATK